MRRFAGGVGTVASWGEAVRVGLDEAWNSAR